MKLTTDYSSQEVTISVILKAYLLSVNGAVGEEKILELNGKSYNLQFYPENGVRCFVWDCRAAREGQERGLIWLLDCDGKEEVPEPSFFRELVANFVVDMFNQAKE